MTSMRQIVSGLLNDKVVLHVTWDSKRAMHHGAWLVEIIQKGMNVWQTYIERPSVTAKEFNDYGTVTPLSCQARLDAVAKMAWRLAKGQPLPDFIVVESPLIGAKLLWDRYEAMEVAKYDNVEDWPVADML